MITGQILHLYLMYYCTVRQHKPTQPAKHMGQQFLIKKINVHLVMPLPLKLIGCVYVV